MTFRKLIVRSLRFHWRSHVGVVLGAAIGSAALIGALIVGDSVRESLRERALERLGKIHFALDAGDRLFAADLPARIQKTINDRPATQIITMPAFAPTTGRAPGSPNATFSTQAFVVVNGTGIPPSVRLQPMTNVVFLPTATPAIASTALSVRVAGVLRAIGTAANEDGSARANQVNVLGINMRLAELGGLRPPVVDETILNESLAAHLGARAGDSVLLRVRKPEAVSAESPVSATDSSVALRLRVREIVPDEQLGNLSLRANQLPPFNAFVPLSFLQSKLGVEGRMNLILAGAVEARFQHVQQSPIQKWAQRLNPRWAWAQTKVSAQTNVLPEAAAFARLDHSLRQSLTLDDLQIQFRWLRDYSGVEARSPRIFIEPALGDLLATNGANYIAQRPTLILTYLVNQFRAGELTTPYSMVTATDSPMLPEDLRDDEIVINQWLADDLKAAPGSEVSVTYFAPDQAAQLIERTNRFRVRAVLPMTHALGDRSLMPDFPGVATAERAGDWETSFPLVHKIRPKDDEYWQQYRGTPKAFVSLRAGQTMWANRFGNLTAVRWQSNDQLDDATALGRIRNAEASLQAALSRALRKASPTNDSLLDASAFGFAFQSVRDDALKAASQSQDFGGLFIGFSFFLIGAALILMALLFQFGIEQRSAEIGTLLALGFRAKQVRRIFLLEGAALAFLGSLVGVVGGIYYARAMLHGLTTVWRSATNTSALTFHASPVTILIGLISGTLVAVVTIWFVLRKQARRPARALLAGDLECGDLSPPSPVGDLSPTSSATSRGGKRLRQVAALQVLLRAPTIAVVALAFAAVLVAWAFMSGESSNAGFFFGAGSLALIAGLAGTSWWLHRWVGRGVLTAPGEDMPQSGAVRTPRPTAPWAHRFFPFAARRVGGRAAWRRWRCWRAGCFSSRPSARFVSMRTRTRGSAVRARAALR